MNKKTRDAINKHAEQLFNRMTRPDMDGFKDSMFRGKSLLKSQSWIHESDPLALPLVIAYLRKTKIVVKTSWDDKVVVSVEDYLRDLSEYHSDEDIVALKTVRYANNGSELTRTIRAQGLSYLHNSDLLAVHEFYRTDETPAKQKQKLDQIAMDGGGCSAYDFSKILDAADDISLSSQKINEILLQQMEGKRLMEIGGLPLIIAYLRYHKMATPCGHVTQASEYLCNLDEYHTDEEIDKMTKIPPLRGGSDISLNMREFMIIHNQDINEAVAFWAAKRK